MTRVVCIGECMVELRAVGEDRFARSYAGDVYNTAVYLKRSLPDARVQFVSATGDDAMSEAMREAWRAQGIDDSLASVLNGGSPGLYLIETDARGERRFQYWRSQSAARSWLKMLLLRGESRLWGTEVVYFSGISLAILTPEDRQEALHLMQRLKKHVGRIAFDPNVRPKLWESQQTAENIVNAAIAVCDILLPSQEDLAYLLGVESTARQLELLHTIGVKEIALTLGAKGCVVTDASGWLEIASPAVERVVDTSGAGDSFNGVYLAARLRGDAPAQAAEAALLVASRVVTHAGAIVPTSVSHC